MKVKTAALVAAGIALVESVLILAGNVPPFAAYAPANLFFILIVYLLLAYCAWGFAGNLKKGAAAGAEIALSANIVCALAAFAGKAMGVPVLGVSVPDLPSLAVVLLLILVVNVSLGAIAGAVVAWIAGKVTAKKKGNPS